MKCQYIILDSISNDQNYIISVKNNVIMGKTALNSSNIHRPLQIIPSLWEAWSPLVLPWSPNYQLKRFSTVIPCSFES